MTSVSKQRCQINNKKIAFLVLCIYASLSGIAATFLPAMVTTLEKRFDLRTSEVSWVVVSADIGYLCAVLFVAYFGGRGNHVKCLVVSAIGMGLSKFVVALPYFILGSRYTADELLGSMKTNRTSGMSSLTLTAACEAGYGKRNGSGILASSNIHHQKTIAITLQVIGNFFHGLSNSPFWSVGVALIDDIMGKKSGVFLGVLFTMRFASPLLGFSFASFFNTLNESLKFFAKSFPGGEKDPFWIGAWWMPFIILGTCILSMAPCLALFNTKAMVERTNNADRKFNTEEGREMVEDSKENHENNARTQPKRKMSFNDFLRLAKTYWTNPIFVLIAVGKIFESAAFTSILTFFPKFIEFHFRMTASDANMFSAIVLCGSFIAATTSSGLISHKFPLSPKGNNLFHAVTRFIFSVLFPFLLLFTCPSGPIMGSDNKSPDFECSPKNCSCPLTYKPVCVDNQNYFSACQAGCSTFNASKSTYSNCLCKNATASPGVCGGPCSSVYWYGCTSFFLYFIGYLAKVQYTQFVMSLGNEETKPIGLATVSFLYGVLGSAIPLVIGELITSMCLVRNPSPTWKSFCVLYDVDKMRVTLHMMSFVPQIISCIFYFLSWYITPRERNNDQEMEEIDTTKGTPS